MMSDDGLDLNHAITLYLKHYPGKNLEEFDSYYGSASVNARQQVRSILDEVIRINPDWDRLSLSEAAGYVESVKHERHPELTPEALRAIGNYYTYLVR
jgi:hypothetical protein